MADITMCDENENCPMRDKCYRAQAIPNEYMQSYADFSGQCNETNEFKYLIEYKDENNTK